MAEDENVDALSMTSELAERLGVVTVSSSNKEDDMTDSSPQSPFITRSSDGTSRIPSNSVPRIPDPGSDSPLSLLSPFIHMLPQEIKQVDSKFQQEIYEALLEAGLKHLKQYLVSNSSDLSSDASDASALVLPSLTTLNNSKSESSEVLPVLSDMDHLEALSMIDRIDSAYETLLVVGSKSSDSPLLTTTPKNPHPSIAANTLSLFAGAAHRHPPSRSIEGAMAAIQDSVTHPENLEQQEPSFECEGNSSDNFGACVDGLLSLACSAGFARLTENLVKLRGSTTFSTNNDTTPLMEACAAGACSTVSKLIELGADLNVESKTKNTALIYAAAGGHPECVRTLLNTGKCDLTKTNENGHCALMEAASSGNWEVVELLMEHGAKQQFLTMNSEFKESPLTLAAYKGHEVVVRYLLSMGRGELSSEELHTALMEASMDGHVEVARALLEHGAPVNMSSESYESPLTLACSGGHDVLAKILLEAGAFIEEANDESYTPLMEAAREGHLNVVRVLLDHGANVNAQTEETGETALTVAACGGYTDVLDVLVRYGGDLELGANTPLMEAAQEGHVGTVIYILGAARADGQCPNIEHHINAASALAADNGHLDVVEVLYKSGADFSLEYEGRTPLMKAAKNGYTDIVLYLISKGVDVNFKSQSGNDATALSLACAAGYKDIVRHLLDAGADPNIELKDGVTCVLEAAKNGYVDIVELMLDHALESTASLGCSDGQHTNAFSFGQNVPKPCSTRRKKANATSISASSKTSNGISTDQIARNSVLYPAGTPCTNQTPTVDPAYSDPEWARVYYGWLATLYNLRQGGNISTDRLPVSFDCALSQASVDINSQLSVEQVQALANYVATLPVPYGPTIESQTTAKETPVTVPCSSTVSASPTPTTTTTSTSITTLKPNAGPAFTSTVSTTSGSFLSNTYETIKKNFAGLPLPSQLPPVYPPETVKSTGTDSVIEPDLKSETTTIPTAEVPMKGWTEAKWDNAVHHFATNLPSDQRKLTRRKFQEYIGLETHNSPDVNSLKHFLDIYQEWTRIIQQKESENDKESLSINDIMKMIRPSAPGLGGSVFSELVRSNNVAPSDSSTAAGSVVSTSTPSAVPAVAPTTTTTTATTAGIQHRRTHSEGDDIDSTRPQIARPVFNVDKATESNNDTPLTLACSNGHKDMVNVLVARGANIEHRDKKGFTPLILAATGGHVGVVHALLTAGANIEAQSERTKDTALSLACSGGRKEVVEVLLLHGANKEHRNVSDYTPLSLAASGGYVEIVNMLLGAGAEINSRTGSKLGISPLMLAAMNGHKEATRVLLEKGSDINAQIETNRNTALTLACFQGRTDVVRLLLQYNANVEHRAKTGLTPLMEAANGGYVEVGELLLDHNADPNTTPVPSSRDTALTIAADKGHEKFVEMLINRGAAIDAKNKKGCTALWLACHGGHLDTVKTLVSCVADVDTQDNRKVSALLIAFRKGHLKVVEYLVDYVKQFPNQQEMVRYLSTLSPGEQKITKELQDLLCNVQKCISVIVCATKHQAEQANKAAESLLALLAEEEEMAKTKKQKKQKKKEEKRAKKSKKNEEKAKASVPEISSKKDISPSRDESEVDSDDEPEPVKKNVQNVEIPNDVQVLERVPVVNVEQRESPSLQEGSTLTAKQKRQNNRKARQAELKVAVSNFSPSLSTTTSPITNKVLICPVPVTPISAPPKTSPQTEEWVKASKKKQSKTKAVTQAIVSPPTIVNYPKETFTEECSGWKDVDLARRKSNTLCVGSSVIARVIGRGGANINAIREATGASIEVEKQSMKKEQHDRQIFIKGTQEVVRNATQMINGLILDNEVSVTDIIRQVLRGNSSVASSSSESGCRIGEGKPLMSLANSTKNNAQPSVTTNVWQQRMAARQQQQQEQLQHHSQSPTGCHGAVSPVSSSSVQTSKGVLDTSKEEGKCGNSAHIAADIEPSISPISSIVDSELSHKPLSRPLSPREEDLRKAPGYRPHIASSNLTDKTTSTQRPAPDKNILPIGDPLPCLEKKECNDSSVPNLEHASFLDESTQAKLAQIWGSGSSNLSNNESAWNSQILLNNISSLSLDSSRSDWPLQDGDFLGIGNFPSSSQTKSSQSPVVSSSNDWMAPGNKNNLSFARNRSSGLQPTPHPASLLQPQPPSNSNRSFPSSQQQTESNLLFNQLAAQLLTHQGSSTSASPYFPYNEPSISSLKQSSTMPLHSQSSKPYASYQNASQEYENLHSLLNPSYAPHPLSNHSSSDFNGQPPFSSSNVPRNVIPSRNAVSYIPPPPPPPGFSGVPPPNIGANTSIPPPPMRNSFFNNQMPPPPHSSAFNLYSSQTANGNWNQTIPPNNLPQPQMPWSGGWN